MLYKFKSQAAADVIMLEVNARQILDAVGKGPSKQGIITAAQIPAAIQALQAAIAAEEAISRQRVDSDEEDEHGAKGASVSLRQRAAPFIDLLQRSATEGKDVVWGV
jgi:cyclopropane-fatty-acyl-phospholipid synthase